MQVMLAQRFATLLGALGPFSPASRYAVALSGGADSLALTLLMHDYVRQQGGTLVALTVDHRLRKESTEEAQRVAAMMQQQGIEHHILTPAHDGASTNLQEAARGWRYDALSAYCRAQGILHCLVAHHAGDNRETVAHNMARGDTADGTSGMRRVRHYRGVRFLRPLLAVERDELEAYVRQRAVRWIDDPSNTNTDFARVRMRMALADDAAQRATLDAALAAGASARAARDHALADAAVQCVSIHPLGFAQVDMDAWKQLPPQLASQLLADCITTISGSTTRPRGQDTMRLVDALQGDFAARTLQHCTLNVKGGQLIIARELARVAEPVMLQGDGARMWDGRFQVRHRLPEGETYRLGALGDAGVKHVKMLSGHVLPAASPALWHLDEVVFVPHIGMPHPGAGQVMLGFAPPKALAAAPFW